MSTTADAIDTGRREAFAGRVIEMLNMASLALMTSVGHQTGLFDTMARLRPSTSEEIARAAGLDERYVREWLGAMVTGLVVEYDADGRTYSLPAEHAASLTRAAGLDNLAKITGYVSLAAEVEQKVIECFRNGGGVHYCHYPRFQTVQAEENGALFDATLVGTTLEIVPGLVDRLRAGVDVLDVGCGSGHAVNVMARAFPKSRFVGYDLSEEGVRAGRAEAEAWGLTNARFEARDVTALGEAGRFDLVTAFDAIHDQARPADVLAGIARSLRDGGVFLMVDIAGSSDVGENVGHPLGTFFYMISCMHCMTVSLAQGGVGLGAMWGEQLAVRMLGEAGFSSVEVERVPGDIVNNYYVARR
jgi:2-polyprenyl-3-methyl-5-hydroxy-6-metoxy-1,4-benzoquinol methylase